MSNFNTFFEKETQSTIEGLLGVAPTVTFKSDELINDFSTIMPPMAQATIQVNGGLEGKLLLLLPPQLASALADKMLGGDGFEKESLDNDDLDATKEIISNIFGALSTTMNAQKELPKLSFSIEKIEFIDDNGTIETEKYYVLELFEFVLDTLKHSVILLFSQALASLTQHGHSEETNTPVNSSSQPSDLSYDMAQVTPTQVLGNDEMKNIALLLDVKLTVRVRIGAKRMLLRDVINMDIGSIIELEQLANEPLDILIEGNKIAEGEVVIVDGNFGVQITSIGSKRERLEQLKS